MPAEDQAAQRALERELLTVRRKLAQQVARDAPSAAVVIPTIEEVCAQLPADTLLLVYGALPDQVVAFTFDRRGPLGSPYPVGTLPERDTLRLDLSRITAAGRLPRDTAQRWARQQIRSAQAPLAAWFERYLGPLRHLLQRYPKLLIVPDDLLNLLPFGALYDPQTDRYLTQSHELLIAPSLATWIMLARRGSPATGPVLAVGVSSGGRLRRAVDEARAVAAAFPEARLLIEEDATRAGFAEAARDAGLIHIATHGLYRTDTPAFSYLELADGRLEAFDIARLELNAGAVVLSACETGIGHLTGNELMGLVRAFLHAGARSVLATHWAVDDEAMAALAADIAQRLAGGRAVTQALHEAQAAWLATHGGTLLAHPCFWGSLIPVGAETRWMQ